jgi:hypothetical protein
VDSAARCPPTDRGPLTSVSVVNTSFIGCG